MLAEGKKIQDLTLDEIIITVANASLNAVLKEVPEIVVLKLLSLPLV